MTFSVGLGQAAKSTTLVRARPTAIRKYDEFDNTFDAIHTCTYSEKHIPEELKTIYLSSPNIKQKRRYYHITAPPSAPPSSSILLHTPSLLPLKRLRSLSQTKMAITNPKFGLYIMYRYSFRRNTLVTVMGLVCVSPVAVLQLAARLRYAMVNTLNPPHSLIFSWSFGRALNNHG